MHINAIPKMNIYKSSKTLLQQNPAFSLNWTNVPKRIADGTKDAQSKSRMPASMSRPGS